VSWTLGIALFFVVWWIVLFAVLPFGVRTQGEAGAVVPGTPASAPIRFRLGRVFMINTVVAFVVFLLIWGVIELDLFGIAEMAAAVNR
jgi:predicted secreted protein